MTRTGMLAAARTLGVAWLCASGCATAGLEVLAVNPLPEVRADETIELPWDRVSGSVGEAVVVVDQRSGQPIPWQVFDPDGNRRTARLLFQASFQGGETRRFLVRPGPPPAKTDFPARAYGRFVPERKDDVAWENDRIAYRVYGPALEATG